MKLPTLLTWLFVTSATSALSLAADTAQKVIWNNPVQFDEPGLSHHSFVSSSMGTEIGYSIWLPPGYETSGERYPVIYFLHGSSGTESADAPAFSHMLAVRLAAKKIPPVICVFPNGGLSGYRDHPESKVNVETMIIRELLPLVDKTFRTRPDRASRVLGGFSMGGGGAVCLALKYSELFSAAASWAGAFDRGNDDGKFAQSFDTDLLKNRKDPVRILMIVGYEDLTYPWHAPAITAFRDAKYPFTLHTIAGLGHELGRYYSLTGDELIGFLTMEFAVPSAP